MLIQANARTYSWGRGGKKTLFNPIPRQELVWGLNSRVSKHRKVSFLSHLIVLSRAGAGGDTTFWQTLRVCPNSQQSDHYTFPGNCPPTPPLSQHQHLLLSWGKMLVRGRVAGQIPRNVQWSQSDCASTGNGSNLQEKQEKPHTVKLVSHNIHLI